MPVLELFKAKTITNLPCELVSHVSSFLPLKSFLNFSQTCKSFYNLEIYSGSNYDLIAEEITFLLTRLKSDTKPLIIQQVLLNILKKTSIKLDFYITYNQHGFDIAGSLLHALILKHSIPLISLILSKNRDLVDSLDTCNWTPLHYAAYEGLEEVCKILIKNGADVNRKDSEGETSLFVAVRSGSMEVIRVLVENGADVNLSDDDGLTCADICEDEEVHKYLVANGAFETEEFNHDFDDLNEELVSH